MLSQFSNSKKYIGCFLLCAAALVGNVICSQEEEQSETLCSDFEQAVKNGDLEIIQRICAQCREMIDFEIGEDDDYGQPALHEAAARGHLPVVEFFINQGVHVDCTDTARQTALHLAVTNENDSVARFLVDRGADVNHPSRFGTPLHRAAESGSLANVRFLLDHGAHLHAVYKHEAPVNKAAKSGHLNVMVYLIQRGAYINPTSAISPLDSALDGGYLNIATFLLDYGADIDALNPRTGQTALCRAAAYGDMDQVTFLVDKWAEVNKAGRNGTPLHMAAQNGHTAALDHLLYFEAEIDMTNHQSQTSLNQAMNSQHLPAMLWLITQYANVNRRDTNSNIWKHFTIVARKRKEYLFKFLQNNQDLPADLCQLLFKFVSEV